VSRVKRSWIGVLVGLMLGLLVACGEQRAAEPTLTGTLPIAVPQTVSAGQPVAVTVGPVTGADGTTATLVAVGSYGTQAYHATFSSGVARFELSPEQARRSGLITLFAQAGAARGTASVQMLPGSAVEPLTPLVGARSITADGRHSSMLVVVPFDAFGNPVAEDTPVTVRIRRPDNRITEQKIGVKHLLGWTRIPSGTRAGHTTISVTTQNVHGPEATLLEVAAFPVSSTLEAEPRSAPANGRELVTLRTSVLADEFGNVLPDGTLVTFVASAPDGQRYFVPAPTINGVAEAPLQAPSEPGIFTVRATVYDVASAPLYVAFTPGPSVGTFPLTANLDPTNGAVMLEAGPILGPLQQYVPDGTPVLFAVTNPAGQQQWLQAIAESGRAGVELRLVDLKPGTYTAEALAGSGRGSTTFDLP
jgi:hypothetical protein